MRKYISTPQQKIRVAFIALAIILSLRLFVLTVVQSDKWDSAANQLSIRGIYNPSPRGSIYDRNGKLLAGNQQIFSVKMRTGDMTNKEINSTATKLINLLNKNGDEYSNNFPIKISDGKFYFTYDEEIKKWLKANKIDENATAEEAFYALRDKMGIDEEDRYKIQTELQQKYNVYPPISVKDMKYTGESDKKTFLEGYGLKEDTTAEKTFKELRKKFEIKDDISDEQAMEIMAIRTELKSLGYKKYMPATIAKDVSDETVMEVEENVEELKGVEIASETKRYYPEGNTAAHIIGYIGKISSSEKDDYEKKGYETSSLIGREGIEGKFESVLKGQDGTEIIRVNAYGDYVETLKEIEPEKGKDVYLTIDSDLQKVAEDALKRNIEACQTGGVFKSEFGNIGVKQASKAKSGAVVAIEVESGDVLAMASYPDYNPNLFTEGISSEDWASLQSKNPRDSLSEAPLYNMATMSAWQPGSTFKPITGMAALESGLNPDEALKDEGFIKIGSKSFGCVAWNTSKSTHGYVNLYKGMQVSCNYYFYDLVTNKDWSTGKSLGMNDDMSVELVISYAQQFGLGESTGIEINETVVSPPSEAKKIASLKNSLKNILYTNAEVYFTEEVYSNSKRLEKDINTIIGWMDEDKITYGEMKKEYLPKVGIKESQYDVVAEMCLYNYFNQAKWTDGDAFNLAIGQGDNAYTPLQMANYLATLGNDGKRNQVSVVKSVEDEGATVKSAPISTDVSKANIEIIKEAMYRVTVGEGSGIASHYSNFPWEVCAKTGTAENSGKINPVSEVDYIKSHLGSFGDMTWADVEVEMKRLMTQYPETYASEDMAVRRAVINLSGGTVTSATLDQFKDTYDEFAWTIAMAPKDDPKIAVVCVIPQGLTGGNADPVVREIIGTYLKEVAPEYKDFKIVNEFN